MWVLFLAFLFIPLFYSFQFFLEIAYLFNMLSAFSTKSFKMFNLVKVFV